MDKINYNRPGGPMGRVSKFMGESARPDFSPDYLNELLKELPQATKNYTPASGVEYGETTPFTIASLLRPIPEDVKNFVQPKATGSLQPGLAAQLAMGAPAPSVATETKPGTQINIDKPEVVEVPKEDTYESDLEAAREEARQNRRGTGILQSISQGIETMTGAKSNAGIYDSAREGAKQNVLDLLGKPKRDFERMQLGEEKDLRDSKSQASVFARDVARKMGWNVPEGTTAAQIYGVGGKAMMEAIEKEKTRNAALQVEELKNKKDQSKAEADLQKDLRERGVAGVGTFPTKEEAAKFRDEAKDALAAKDDIKALMEIGQSGGWGSRFNPEDRVRAETRVKALVGKLRQPITGPGAMTKEERESLISIIGDPTAFFGVPSLTQSKLQELNSIVSNSLKRSAQVRGADPSMGASKKSSLQFEDPAEEAQYQEWLKGRK